MRRLGWKLFRLRADGTLGPLFINSTLCVPVGKWLWAEDHPTDGYAHRPGWHVLPLRRAPHLSMRGRVWARVEIEHFVEHKRPANQGGRWFLARRMRVLRVMNERIE